MLVKVNIQIEENMKQTTEKKSKNQRNDLQTKGQSRNI